MDDEFHYLPGRRVYECRACHVSSERDFLRVSERSVKNGRRAESDHVDAAEKSAQRRDEIGDETREIAVV